MHPQTISRAARAAFLPILIAGGAALAAPRAARAAEPALTHVEAIELALSHNEQIAIDRESFSAAKAGLTGARGAYDPLLQISGGWQRSREPLNSSFSGVPLGSAPTYKASEGTLSIRQLLPTGASLSIAGRAAHETTSGSLALLTPANSTQIGVELRQPLLRGFAIDPARANVRVARSQRSGAEAALRSTVTETIASVEQGYWSLIAARQAVDVLEESVRLAQEQLEETESRVKTGAAPETETAQPRAELQRRTGDLLAARENLSRAENALKVQILSDEDPLWADRLIPAVEPTVDPSPVDVAALMDQALDRRPELRAGAAAIERRRAETSLARN
ncbi:MAG: TolC family protein, partial [Candidatus Eisenbacteria bacterium]|nr:TolC family protein [Candidatus Eisenbacteria bacterium]